METKTCSKCHKEKHLKHFVKHKHTKDGHNSWCRLCGSQLMRERREALRQSPNEIAAAEAKRQALLAPMEMDCYHGDYTKTHLYINQRFISGDGGYQEYIDKINMARA